MAPRQSARRLLQSLLALGTLSPLTAAFCLEVGPLRVFEQSGPGLLAEIPVSGTETELDGLSVRIASADLYTRAGHVRPPFIASLNTAVDHGSGSAGRIVLKSANALPPGQTVLLLELRWPDGELVRGYALDGPPAPSLPPSPAMPRPPAAAPHAASSGTYLSQSGDSLGSIAQQTAAPGVSVARQMAAIFALNPQHFEQGDPHRLRVGALLRLPTQNDPALDAPAVPAPGARQASAEGAELPRLQIGRGRSPSPGQEERLLVLEDSLASQSRQMEDRDGRLRALENAVVQLTELVSLQRQQLAALGVSAPAATPSAPDPYPLAIAHSLTGTDAPPPPPWYRREWVQQGVIGFALLMFVLLIYTEARYHLRRYLRRRRRRLALAQL